MSKINPKTNVDELLILICHSIFNFCLICVDIVCAIYLSLFWVNLLPNFHLNMFLCFLFSLLLVNADKFYHKNYYFALFWHILLIFYIITLMSLLQLKPLS